MKKFLSYIIVIMLTVYITPSVFAYEGSYFKNANNIEMTEEEYNNLLALGFQEKSINKMDLETFNANKNIDATVEAHTIKFYKTTTTTKYGITTSDTKEVSSTEYERVNPTRSETFYDGFVETSYKRMDTYIARVNSDTLRYTVTLDWKTIPSRRSYDIIGIGFQQAYVDINTPPYFRQYFTYVSGTSSYSDTCIPQEFNTGAGASFQLPTGPLDELTIHLYYNVYKVASGTVTELRAGGDYAHATSTVSAANSQRYTINHVTGIDLDESIMDDYDTIPVATATWYGSW